jgi:hypothetical protein
MLRFENFNLNRIKDMSHNDAKTYIDKYFFVLSDGKHAMYNHDTKKYDIQFFSNILIK